MPIESSGNRGQPRPKRQVRPGMSQQPPHLIVRPRTIPKQPGSFVWAPVSHMPRGNRTPGSIAIDRPDSPKRACASTAGAGARRPREHATRPVPSVIAQKNAAPHIFPPVTACRLLSQIGTSDLFEVDPTSNVYDKIKVIAGSEIGERGFPAQGRKTTLSVVRVLSGRCQDDTFLYFLL